MNCFEFILALIVILIIINVLWAIGVAIFWIAVVIAIVAGCVYGFKYIALFLANCGMRNKFVYDHLIWLQTESATLEENGFVFIDYIASGLECPGKIYFCSSKKKHAKVILHTSLGASSFQTSVVFTDEHGTKLIEEKYSSNIAPEYKREKIINAMSSL